MFRPKLIFSVFIEFGAGHVDTETHVGSRFIPGLLDTLQDDLQRRFVGLEIRGKSALIAHGCVELHGVQHFFQGMKNLGATAQRFGKCRGTHRQDHEFLEIDVVIGMRTAVDDVHHRHRQLHRHASSQAVEVTVERLPGFGRRRARARERHRQHGIGAETRFVVGSIEIDHGSVNAVLITRLLADQRLAYFTINVGTGLFDALAAITPGVAVAQFDGLAAAGGGAGGHGGTADGTGFQGDIRFNSGIPTRIEYLARTYIGNRRHGCYFLNERIFTAKAQRTQRKTSFKFTEYFPFALFASLR